MQFSSGIFLSLFGLCMALGASSETKAQDLDLLFAPPTQNEISTVVEDWSSRPSDGTDFLIERIAEEDGFTIARVSFRFEGLKQYAMLRYPRNFTPNGTYPVLMVHHGGTQGFNHSYGLDFDSDFPTGCLADECLVFVPTYRGEAIVGGDALGIRVSEGEKSVWDRDCDDAMALLAAVLASMPEADPGRLYSLGRSRGAGVAYHMALRDPRLRRSEVFFGPTDFFQENIRQDIQATIDGGPVPTNTLSIKVWDLIVTPWLAGEKTLEQARLLMIGWSPLYFVNPDVSMQVHHGEADENIPVYHGESFAAAMIAAGATAPEYELFTYPGAGHDTNALIGYEERVEEYLCLPGDVSLAPDHVFVSALEAWPNPFTKSVLIQETTGGGKSGFSQASKHVRIFDARGLLVRSVVLSATGTARWDGTDVGGRKVGAGIYFMEQFGNEGMPLKVILLP